MNTKGRLSRLFSPECIAVIGASEKPGSVGREVVENLLLHGYKGKILPVNPKYESLLDLDCYPDVASLPQTPDLLAVAVPARFAADTIRAAGEAGIPFAVVYASGFSETGKEGAALQAELSAVAAEHGVGLIGPNCQGYMNIADRIHVGFGPAYRQTYRSGSVGVVSQSGAFGNSLLLGLDAEKVGVRHYVSTGNEAGLSALDVIEAMLEDPEIEAICGYIEGFRDARPLRRIAARAAERNVPIILWKVGTSEIGATAAASHTANLAGDSRFYDAAFAQLGIVSVSDVGDMADCIRGVLGGRRTSGKRVGVVTISGGAGIAMADMAEELGITLDPLAPETEDILRERLPAFASVANPLDVTAGALTDPESVEISLDHVARDPNVDMIALAIAAASGKTAETVAVALKNLQEHSNTPLALAWNARAEGNETAIQILDDARIPVYPTPGRAIRGLSAVNQTRAGESVDPRLAQVSNASSDGAVRTLDESASKTEIEGTGIDSPEERVVNSAEEAASAAAELGFPVVLKLLSETIVHKSDIGGVRLNLSSVEEVSEAFDGVAAAAAKVDSSGAPVQALVQQQIPGGVEAILGARLDPNFGPMVMVGCGGILAELVSDVSFRLAPISVEEAREMISETKLQKLLDGVRGKPPADAEALAQAVAGLSERIAAPESHLSEIEINPLFVRGVGEGVIAGDCVTRIFESDPS